MDIHKAYNTVEWNALEDILQEMNFPRKFTNWIMICVFSISCMYSINGNYTEMLQAQRGIRQGDLISPLLFVLVTEYLHMCLGNLKDRPDFNFHPKYDQHNLISISFVDDLMLFSRGDKTSVQILMEEF